MTKSIWAQVMELRDNGREETNDVANIFSRDDLNTILATADFFGCSENEMSLIYMDLSFAKYRMFDWLAMAVGGRIENEQFVKVMVHSFLKCGGVPSKVIEDLQTTDYDIFRDWEEINLGREE